MSAALDHYQVLQKKLAHIRWTHLGFESAEEDELLDQMDAAWWALSPEDIELLSKGPQLSAPIYPEVTATPLEDVDTQSTPGPVRRLAA